MSRSILSIAIMLLSLSAATAQEATSKTNSRLKSALERFPAADADKDGVLTATEARRFVEKRANSAPQQPTGRVDANSTPEPTFADVKYGPHERNVLDVWKATSHEPTPAVVLIHGGGFLSGDKRRARSDALLPAMLERGVSFVSINYRFRPATPIQEILRDCARAIQFVRFKADEWNIDKQRLAVYGGSAGAGASLWLAVRDDLADPNSDDPVLRESSRPIAAGANSVQATYDLLAWESLMGDAVREFGDVREIPIFYGMKSHDELTTPEGARLRADVDMINLISKDDPPLFLNSTAPGGKVTSHGHLLHHPKHAEALLNRGREVGAKVIANLPGLGIRPRSDEPQNLRDFLLEHLGVNEAHAGR